MAHEPELTAHPCGALSRQGWAWLEALRVVDQHAQLQRALLKGKQREVKDVVTAALTLGRSQFPKGSAQREIISAIPKGKSAEKKEP